MDASSLSVPLHKERERSTERSVGLEVQRLSRDQAQAGKACAQFLDDNARLEASQRRAKAIMRSEPEGEVLLGILPMDVEKFGGLEDRGIVVRGAEQQKQVRVGRDRHTADLHRLGRLAAPGDDRGVEAQYFLDRVRDQRGVAAGGMALSLKADSASANELRGADAHGGVPVWGGV